MNKLNVLLIAGIVFLISGLTTIGVFTLLNRNDATVQDIDIAKVATTIPTKELTYDKTYFGSCASNALSKTQSFTLSDTFDKASIDPSLWFFSDTGNSVSNGNLVQSAQSSFQATWISSKDYLKGDFSTEIAINSFNSIDSVKDKDAIFFLKAIDKDSNFFNIIIVKNYRGISISIGGIINAKNELPYLSSQPLYVTSLTNLKSIKLERISNTAYAYLDFGSGYEKALTLDNVSDEAMSIGFGNQNFGLENQAISSLVGSISAVGCKLI